MNMAGPHSELVIIYTYLTFIVDFGHINTGWPFSTSNRSEPDNPRLGLWIRRTKIFCNH